MTRFTTRSVPIVSNAASRTDVIEIAPLAFMRGRTLCPCGVILDEAQNSTSMQMKMFLTRLGRGLEDDRHRRSEPDRLAAWRQIRPV
jgi:predicted ribonuclease YlaK